MDLEGWTPLEKPGGYGKDVAHEFCSRCQILGSLGISESFFQCRNSLAQTRNLKGPRFCSSGMGLVFGGISGEIGSFQDVKPVSKKHDFQFGS